MHTPFRVSVPEQTEEQKKANKERLEEWLKSWNEYSAKYPDLARRMIA